MRRLSRSGAGSFLFKSVNDAQATLVVQVARKTLDAYVCPEYHVNKHAMVACRNAPAGEIHPQGVFRDL